MMIKPHGGDGEAGIQLHMSSNLSYCLLGDLVSNTEDQTKVSDLLLEIPLEEVPSRSVLPLGE